VVQSHNGVPKSSTSGCPVQDRIGFDILTSKSYLAYNYKGDINIYILVVLHVQCGWQEALFHTIT